MHNYESTYKKSIENKEDFMREKAYELLDWFIPFDEYQDRDGNFFRGGIINSCYNAVDRHLIRDLDILRRRKLIEEDAAEKSAGLMKGYEIKVPDSNNGRSSNNQIHKESEEEFQLNGSKTAIVYVDDRLSQRRITYANLYVLINKIANFIISLEDTPKCVTLYAPASIEIFAAVLACSRLGIPVNYVFGGFSDVALSSRIKSSKSTLVITVDKVRRGNKDIDFLKNVTDAVKLVKNSVNILVFDKDVCDLDTYEYGQKVYDSVTSDFIMYNGDESEYPCCSKINKNGLGDTEKSHMQKFNSKAYEPSTSESKDGVYYKTFHWKNINKLNFPAVKCVGVPSDHHMIYLFTSGSTGVPKCIVLNTGGYLFGTAMDSKHVFDFDKNGVFFSTADIGWLAAVSHSLYGPLTVGGTTVISSNTPFSPTPLKVFKIISDAKVTHFYSAPTVFRMLKKTCTENKLSRTLVCSMYDVTSLKVIGSVGEILDNQTSHFVHCYFRYEKNIINTYWQTETGSILLAPLPVAKSIRNMGVGMPSFGIEPVIANYSSTSNNVIPCKANEKGLLLFKGEWPSLLHSILNDHYARERMYLSKFPGYFYTGDEAMCDSHGNYHILGRVDDVINMCGHRVSTSEVESVVMKCGAVAEAAVIPAEDEIVGQRLVVFAVSINGRDVISARDHIINYIRKEIGPIIRHVEVRVVRELPKTRSGKIMRRLLRSKGFGDDLTGCVNPETLCEIFNQ